MLKRVLRRSGVTGVHGLGVASADGLWQAVGSFPQLFPCPSAAVQQGRWCTQSTPPRPSQGIRQPWLVMSAAVAAAGAAVWQLSKSDTPRAAQHAQRGRTPPDRLSEAVPDPLLQAAQQLQSQSAEQLNSRPAQQTTSPLASEAAAQPQGPWVTDPVLAAALPHRQMTEARLRSYIEEMQRKLQPWLEQASAMGRLHTAEFQQEMRDVQAEVDAQSAKILYNSNAPNAHREYLAQYGCTKPSSKALETIKQYGPVLELGAGLGFWERALREQYGVDIIAVDNGSSLPVADATPDKPAFVGRVVQGDEQLIAKHPNRTLLMVYPGPDAMAAQALELYKGQHLLYVGESRGGVNASDKFFDALEKNWECVQTVPVQPFKEGYEQLWVLRRRNTASKRRWW